MSIHLVGGGWSDTAAPEVFGGFLRECAARAAGRRTPRVSLVLMGTDAESLEYHERYVRALGLAGEPHELAITRVEEGTPCQGSALEDLDGLFVGGGPTPEYHASLEPLFARIRELVSSGVPYLGFSAGAAIAAERAIIGGWRVDGVVVCPEDANEELDELAVVGGIGLVPFAVDVHSSQWGTLGRLVGAVEAGLLTEGLAVDESTVVTVGEQLAVRGEGRVRRVVAGEGGVTVTAL